MLEELKDCPLASLKGSSGAWPSAKQLDDLAAFITREIDRAKAEGWNAAVEKGSASADRAIKDRALRDNLSPGDCAAIAYHAIQALKDKHDDA